MTRAEAPDHAADRGATGDGPPIIDSQVHVWLRPGGEYPWAPGFLDQLPREIVARYTSLERPAGELVGMMDEIGVTTTFLTSPWLYGSDHTYAFSSARRHPGRFVVVAPFDLPLPDAASALASFRARRYALGPRILLGAPSGGAPASPASVDAVLTAAARLGMPVFVSPIGRFAEVGRMARIHPSVTLVLDHAGLWLAGPVARRWELLEGVLELAAFPNILVKCSALPELSGEPYPFPDLWRILHPLLERFGADRLMWGSDINQHRDSLTYARSLDYIRESPEISGSDRERILGTTAARLLRSSTGPVPTDRLTDRLTDRPAVRAAGGT